ncbi:NUDIX hydrolase [Sphingomonas bacterium]|uniref:NUDIX hydrolase n=1 Tax=Sphingomonas bacterium TaxID=1895847 RepID=UPI0020C71697|nr:NUDIX domain-containing protein [Sphingomonas bacterium]
MTDPVPGAIPAATLIVLCATPGGPPAVLMVQRSRAMAFAAGALVFPGGRVDPGDRLLAGTAGDEGAARVAAIRETLEEAGLAIGLDLPAGTLEPLRAALSAGEPFGRALAAVGGTLHPERLVPFARWIPPHRESRVFDTRFYLAALPVDAPPASVDGTENDRLLWASARDVLAEADAGRASVIFPTRRNLERLALFDSHAAAVADALAHPVATICPWIEDRDGERWLCIAEGLGYPVTAEREASALRG